MNFSAWSIRRPLPAILTFVLLTVAGLYAFAKLPVSRFPEVNFPLVTVTIVQPGATPRQLETDVTRKVEDAVAGLSGIKTLTSIVVDGSSITNIEFQLSRDANEALNEVRDAVARLRGDLPADVEEPAVVKQNFVGGALLTFTVQPRDSGADAMPLDALSWFVDDKVTKALFGLRGVGGVRRIGGVEREVRIDLRPEALQAWGVTAGAVSQQLARLQVERPGGRTTLGGKEQAVRTVGTVQDVAALRELPITLADGRQVRLGALASVTDGAAEPRMAALLDGKPAVAFAVTRTRGSSEVALGHQVRERVAQLAAQYPRLQFTEVQSTIEEAQASYHSSMVMLAEGALLAVLVVWWFLRDWRATWITAFALPMSIIPTFAVMYWFGFSLNLVTLLALALVVGLLVDDAIVEVENIERHLRMGKTPYQAALEAADEIGLAVVATTMTLAAVFLPVAFMPGIAGQFFREFGWTAATAVLFSLMVARLLTPMMAAYLMKPQPHVEREPRLLAWYLGWADRATRNRWKTLGLALLFFIGSLALVPLIPSTFIPPSDLGRSVLNVELPPGATLAETTRVAELARTRLQAALPELASVYTTIGALPDQGDYSQMGNDDIRRAAVMLNWTAAAGRTRSQQQLEHEVRRLLADLAGARLSFLSSGPGENMLLVLTGDDAGRLTQAAQAFERDLRAVPGLGTITSSASLLRPEVVVTPDPVRAAELGVSTTDIAEAARVATAGDVRQRLAKLNLPERQIPIRVRLAEDALAQEDLLKLLRVPGKNGAVPLAAVADIRIDSGPARIDRFNRSRNITLTAELNGRPLGDVMQEVEALASLKALPPGVSMLNTGDAEVFVELFTGFALAMAAGLFCVYAVLLLLFNSVLQPVTILIAVPLCAGGAFGALLATQIPLSLPALIGLLMLIGIATKNSILLVDYAVLAEKDGMNQHDALIDACRKRARPVVMTSIAMGAGMLPIALALGSDASFRQPMGVAVIGGLITSTLLSLLVIPAAYTVMDDATRWLRRRLRPATTGAPRPSPSATGDG